MRLRSSIPILALACSASFASAQTIDLAWNDCITQPSAAMNAAYTCDGNMDAAPIRLVVSFSSPANLDQFVGIQAVMDLQTSDLQHLPDWWRLGIGECREGALTFKNGRFTGIGTGTTGVCRNPWIDSLTGGGYQWTSEYDPYIGGPGPGRAKLKVAFARITETSLQAGQRYIGCVLELEPGPLASEEEPCVGCALAACMAVNQVELYQTAGQVWPNQDIYYVTATGIRKFVTWQGGDIGGSGCPAQVPTRRTTWGAIKAIYR